VKSSETIKNDTLGVVNEPEKKGSETISEPNDTTGNDNSDTSEDKKLGDTHNEDTDTYKEKDNSTLTDALKSDSNGDTVDN